MARIIYISTRNTAPSGGVKVLFQHVAALRELGFDASIGHPIDGFQPDWFTSTVPIIYYLKGLRINADDVVVIPETGKHTMRLFRDASCQKVIFCQNQFGIIQGLGETRHWQDSDVADAFACSEVVARWVERLMGIKPVPVIGPAIEAPFFEDREPKRFQIAYMPRKRPQDAEQVRRLLNLLHPEFSSVPWLPVADRSVDEVAQMMGQSAIFLSLSHREGLGLPPLEAMAAGCLVAGFHGHGGRDYATGENGFWAVEDDLLDCAAQLGRALHSYQADNPATRHRREAGRQTAGRYTDGVMRRALADYWGPIHGDDKSR